MGQAADLAHTEAEEKENQQQRPAADRQPDKQPDPYNDRNAGRARTERTHKAIPKGVSLAGPSNHSSDTHNIRTWVQCSWGPNRMLMLSWCRGVEGGRIPDEL